MMGSEPEQRERIALFKAGEKAWFAMLSDDPKLSAVLNVGEEAGIGCAIHRTNSLITAEAKTHRLIANLEADGRVGFLHTQWLSKRTNHK